jgi:hypothetical protein
MADFKGGRHTNATLKAIQSLYQNSKICIKYNDGQISEPIKGMRQGCGVSPELF